MLSEEIYPMKAKGVPILNDGQAEHSKDGLPSTLWAHSVPYPNLDPGPDMTEVTDVSGYPVSLSFRIS